MRALVSVVTGRTDPGTNGDGYGSLGRGPGEAVWASRMASASKLSTVPLNTATPRDLGALFPLFSVLRSGSFRVPGEPRGERHEVWRLRCRRDCNVPHSV